MKRKYITLSMSSLVLGTLIFTISNDIYSHPGIELGLTRTLTTRAHEATVFEPTFQKISVGDYVSEEDRDSLINQFKISGISSDDIMNVSGVEINQLINDESNRDTPVHITSLVSGRNEGYGVQVQITTPDTLNNLSGRTLSNILTTAGIRDSLVKLGSKSPVEDNHLLMGVYSIYDFYNLGINKNNILIAQQELKVIQQILKNDKVSEFELNKLITDMKLKAWDLSSQKERSSEEIGSELKDYLSELNKKSSISSHSEKLIQDFLMNYLKLDLPEIIEQLKFSNDNKMTYERAIDLYSGIQEPVIDNHIHNESYDEKEWQLIDTTDESTILRYGNDGDYYEFIANSKFVNINITKNNPLDNSKDDLGEIRELLVDRNSHYLLGIRDHQILNEHFKGKLDESTVVQYVGKIMYPEWNSPIAMYNKPSHVQTNVKSQDLIIELANRHDHYRVKFDGWLDILNNYRTSKHSVSFPMVVEGVVVESFTEGASDINDTDPTEPGVYTDEKDQQLDGIMKQLSEQEGTDYQKYTKTKPGNMYGPLFPNEVIKSLNINGEPVSAEWSEDGRLSGESNVVVVAAYNNLNKGTGKPADFYLFAIVNGQPTVLHSNQNQGMPDGRYYFEETDNPELQEVFNRLLNEN